MDGFYINEKILHGLRQRVKQQAFLDLSLAIFTKQDGTKYAATRAGLRSAKTSMFSKLR
jgi:hypothetical protein